MTPLKQVEAHLSAESCYWCDRLSVCVPGGRHSSECTLILTEGDSAKSLAVSGLGVIGRDRYGVFPLRGKILNVREASHKQVNAPSQNIMES